MRRAPVLVLLLLAIAGCAIGVDALRLGFYSDDWLLLDAARRAPLGDELLGRHGVWPWYRPLAREAYFLAIVAAGPLGIVLARALALAAVVASAYALFRLAPRAFAGRGGAIAATLFLTFAQTKALAAWASGFQDLAAGAFTLLAVLALDRDRRTLALGLAACAMFSKETGFVVVPLLLAWDVLVARRKLAPRWIGALAGTTAAAVAIHALVRLSWPVAARYAGGDAAGATAFPWARLGEFFAGFWSAGPAHGALAIALGIAAGVAAAALVRAEPEASADRGRRDASPSRAGGFAFAALALALGLLPVLVALAAGLATLQPWHAYPALAGTCLLVAGVLAPMPRPAQAIALAALVTVNAWGQSWVAPRPDELRASAPPARGWWLEVRDEARTRLLERDVRRLLADRPEGLVVLYERLPYFSYLQTADGPATREMLGDRTVHTYYLGDAPRGLVPGRTDIIVGRPDSLGLERLDRSHASIVALAVENLLRGEPRPAHALIVYARGARALEVPETYLDGISAGLDDGAEAMAGSWRSAGWAGTTMDSAARSLGGSNDRELCARFRSVLVQPASAEAHVALADSLLARGADVPAAIELRVAARLDPEWGTPALRLGDLCAAHERWEDARAAYAAAARATRPPGIVDRARERLEALDRTTAR
jgi:hypothetical protein